VLYILVWESWSFVWGGKPSTAPRGDGIVWQQKNHLFQTFALTWYCLFGTNFNSVFFI